MKESNSNKQWKRVPFDIELAKKIQAGEIEGRIMTKEGYPVRIVCWDVEDSKYVLIGLRKDGMGIELGMYFSINGECASAHQYDLVLEVPDNEPQFKPFDKVLVKNEGCPWSCALFSHMSDLDNFPYSANNFLWKYCIPYEGNENLVGTTDKPKEE